MRQIEAVRIRFPPPPPPPIYFAVSNSEGVVGNCNVERRQNASFRNVGICKQTNKKRRGRGGREERERERERETDRQTDRQTETETDRQRYFEKIIMQKGVILLKVQKLYSAVKKKKKTKQKKARPQ